MSNGRRRRRQEPPTRQRLPRLPETPTLAQLEAFSDQGLREWRRGWNWHLDLYSELYFGMEKQRAKHANEITDALLKNAAPSLQLHGWGRIVDFQYGMAPLSISGSLFTEGGRFNIGRRLNPTAFSPFGALYLADSHRAAYAEKYGMARDDAREGLSADELILRAPASHSFVSIVGLVEHVFDAGHSGALADVVNVMAKFKIPERAFKLARSIKRVPPEVIRTVEKLQTQILHPHWNTLPIHFDLPSNSQIFGRLLHAAGFHGVLYPSARHDSGRCLALFPDNFKGTATRIHVRDPVPTGARLVTLDGATAAFE
jgi:hypothetical protein